MARTDPPTLGHRILSCVFFPSYLAMLHFLNCVLIKWPIINPKLWPGIFIGVIFIVFCYIVVFFKHYTLNSDKVW